MSESEQPRSAEDLVRMWAAERTRAERAEREIAETRPILIDIRDRQLPALMAWKEDALEAQQVLGLKLAQAEEALATERQGRQRAEGDAIILGRDYEQIKSELEQAEAELGRLREALSKIVRMGAITDSGDLLIHCSFCGGLQHEEWCPSAVADAALAGQEEGKQDA